MCDVMVVCYIMIVYYVMVICDLMFVCDIIVVCDVMVVCNIMVVCDIMVVCVLCVSTYKYPLMTGMHCRFNVHIGDRTRPNNPRTLFFFPYMRSNLSFIDGEVSPDSYSVQCN